MHAHHGPPAWAIVFIVFAAGLLYFLPAIIAGMRGHQNRAPISILNFFLGWTGIVWIIALAWSMSEVRRWQPPIPVALHAYRDMTKKRTRAGVLGAVIGVIVAAALINVVIQVERHRPEHAPMPSTVPALRVNGQRVFPPQNPAAEQRPDSSLNAKVARLREELNKFGPEVAQQRNVIAQEHVRVEQLGKELAANRTNMDKEIKGIREARTALENKAVEVVFEGQRIPRERALQRLTTRWEAYKDNEKAQRTQEELLTTRREKLEVAQTRLRSLEARHRDLSARIEAIELELAKLNEAQSHQEQGLVEAQTSRIQKLLEEAEGQLGRARKPQELHNTMPRVDEVDAALEQKDRVERALKEMEAHFKTP